MYGQKRPKCGPGIMGEYFGKIDGRDVDAGGTVYMKDYRAWEKWSDGREVEAYGKCKKYERKAR
jgi:hypothetical protein